MAKWNEIVNWIEQYRNTNKDNEDDSDMGRDITSESENTHNVGAERKRNDTEHPDPVWNKRM